MKKQILSLMACAAFISTTPAFCMDPPEEEKPEGHFSKLPVEAQLDVSDKLDNPKDFRSMACVSKHFNELLLHYKKIPLEILYTNKVLGSFKDQYNSINFSLCCISENNKGPLGHFEMTVTEEPIEVEPLTPKQIEHMHRIGMDPNTIKRPTTAIQKTIKKPIFVFFLETQWNFW